MSHICSQAISVKALHLADGFVLPLFLGVLFQPLGVSRDVAVSLAFVQEEPGVAEAAVRTEGAVELSAPGVSAVLVVVQNLPVLGGVRAEAAAVKSRRRNVLTRRVFELHVFQ